MAASALSTSSSSQPARSLYRSLLKELRSNPNNAQASAPRRVTLGPTFRAQPLVSLVRDSFRAAPAAQTSPHASQRGSSQTLQEMRDLETYLRSNRVHKELLARYNPLHDQTERERVRATARRVGLDVPIEYKPENADAAQGYEEQASAIRKKYVTGPLPPPNLD
ncbi:unnamed protein product [Parajaminaea phylloscopi]